MDPLIHILTETAHYESFISHGPILWYYAAFKNVIKNMAASGERTPRCLSLDPLT